MRQEFYKLANEMNSAGGQNMQEEEILDRCTKETYKNYVHAAICREKGRKKRKHLQAAAACLILLSAVTVIFHREVQAAMEQIRYSLSPIFGKDLSRYSEVVHASVSDGGYCITLQEVLVAQEELLLSYTIQREDGQPVEMPCTIQGMLFVNGERITGGSGISSGYLNEEKTILGCEMNHRISGLDLSGKNTYELKFEDLEQKVQGSWDFKFEAEGSELFAETKRMLLNQTCTLPDGNTITLEELSVNELKQQITFHTAKEAQHMELELRAVDEKGRSVQFQLASYGPSGGIFENGYMIDAGEPKKSWIAPDAETLTVTLYGYQLPETDGEILADDAYPLSEPFTWDLTGLK